MAKNIKAAELLYETNGQVISISSFQERLSSRARLLARVAEEEPHRMILLAEQAHGADRIEQAKSLIERAYALYDQCSRAVGTTASEGNTAANDAPKNLTSTISSPDGTRRSPLS